MPSALPIILIQSRRFSLLQLHSSIEVHRNSTKASKFTTIMLRTIRHAIVISASITPDDHPRHGAVVFFQWPRRWFAAFPDVCLDAIATIIRVSGLWPYRVASMCNCGRDQTLQDPYDIARVALAAMVLAVATVVQCRNGGVLHVFSSNNRRTYTCPGAWRRSGIRRQRVCRRTSMCSQSDNTRHRPDDDNEWDEVSA